MWMKRKRDNPKKMKTEMQRKYIKINGVEESQINGEKEQIDVYGG